MGYSYGRIWTDEKIKEEILRVMNSLNLNRMPSCSEIEMVTGNSKLSNAIRRSGGTYEIASKLKLDIKESDTKMGKNYESVVAGLLKDKGFEVEQMSVRHPYDLLVNKAIKVDVKVARKYYYENNQYFYTFNLEKKCATCDIYVCLALGVNDAITKCFVIPSSNARVSQLSVGEKSSYDIYLDRWDYFDKFTDFYNKSVF